jgi:hypothetical protein
LADDSDLKSLATEVVNEFGVDMQTAQLDVEAFLSELSSLGLVEENS